MLGKFDDTRHFFEGQKIGDKLLKQLQKDDPRSALIALAMCSVVAAKACGIHQKHVNALMETVREQLEKSPVEIAGQDAISALIVPGRV